MQYNSKRKDEFLQKYLSVLRTVDFMPLIVSSYYTKRANKIHVKVRIKLLAATIFSNDIKENVPLLYDAVYPFVIEISLKEANIC